METNLNPSSDQKQPCASLNPIFEAFKRIKHELGQLSPNDKKEAINALKVYFNECDEPNNIYYNSWTRK